MYAVIHARACATSSRKQPSLDDGQGGGGGGGGECSDVTQALPPRTARPGMTNSNRCNAMLPHHTMDYVPHIPPLAKASGGLRLRNQRGATYYQYVENNRLLAACAPRTPSGCASILGVA